MKWEYMNYVGHGIACDLDKLNELGQEGWQLTAVIDGQKWNAQNLMTYMYIFKRPL